MSVTAQNGSQTVTVPGQQSGGANIVLLVDVSGSITGDALENLNTAIRGLAADMPEGSQLGLVEFAEGCTEGEVFASADDVPRILTTGGSTYIAQALRTADAMLSNTALWLEPQNKKAVVIISDGQICDPQAALAAVNGAKQSIHFYTVNVNADEAYLPAEACWINGGYGSGADYGMAVMQALSNNYLEPAIVDYSFIYQTFAFGERNPDGADYAFGLKGAGWAEVFDAITQNEITQTVEVPMSGIVIRDTLSEYVDLAFQGEGYGITVDGADDYTAAVDGREITVALGGELEDGVTYTVNIPVEANETARAAAQAAVEDHIELPSNAGAELDYSYGGEHYSLPYLQSPTFTLEKQYAALTVHYVYMEGTPALEDYYALVPCGQPYSVPSPELEGYTPNISAVVGVMGYEGVTVTVTYIGEFLWGDADCDGDCDWADVTVLYQHLIGINVLYAQGWINANVYGSDPSVTPIDMSGIDNKLDYLDLSVLVLYLIGE